MHVVLGASGPIGRYACEELARRGEAAVGVGRKKSAPGITMRYADLTDRAQTVEACRDATHIYLTVGIAYRTKVWREVWPVLMENAIEAAKRAGARLIFLDNIYMYGPAPLQVPIAEDHPLEPSSRKGRIRKEIADRLIKEWQWGDLRAIIARCPDYYGPGGGHSTLYETVVSRLMARQDALWLGTMLARHSLAYTVDAGKAMATLALDETAYNQVWHLPTASPPMTGREIGAEFARLLGRRDRMTSAPAAMVRFIGIFVPVMGELADVFYQYESDYVFSSAKFEAKYPDFKITPYLDGFRQWLESVTAARQAA